MGAVGRLWVKDYRMKGVKCEAMNGGPEGSGMLRNSVRGHVLLSFNYMIPLRFL